MHNQSAQTGVMLAKQLMQARLAKGYTEEDLANALRISPDIIHTIETNGYSTDEMNVYVKGYVRAYARLVGADTGLVDAHFAALGVLKKPKLAAPAKFRYGLRRVSRLRVFLLIVLAGILLALTISWVHGQRANSLSPTAVGASIKQW